MVCLSEGQCPHNNLKQMTNEDLNLDQELTSDVLKGIAGSSSVNTRQEARLREAIAANQKRMQQRFIPHQYGEIILDGVKIWV